MEEFPRPVRSAEPGTRLDSIELRPDFVWRSDEANTLLLEEQSPVRHHRPREGRNTTYQPTPRSAYLTVRYYQGCDRASDTRRRVVLRSVQASSASLPFALPPS